MNYYPGEGLGIGTALLGNTVGQLYPTGAIFPLCKIFGTILTMSGLPVGVAGSTLKNGPTGATLVETWKGTPLTITLSATSVVGGRVIATERAVIPTNDQGYFEVYVIQGLMVKITSPVLGAPLEVDTLGFSSIDISTFF